MKDLTKEKKITEVLKLSNKMVEVDLLEENEEIRIKQIEKTVDEARRVLFEIDEGNAEYEKIREVRKMLTNINFDIR